MGALKAGTEGNSVAARPDDAGKRKPTWLTYGAEERPPVSAALLLGLQHAGLAIMFMVYPVVIVQALELSIPEASALISASLVAIGLATILQSRRPPLGSGELAVHIPTPVMLPALLQAGALGGIGLIAGMTLVLGLAEAGLARVLHRLRKLFPPEVCGVAVFMLGVSIGAPALERFSGAVLHEGQATAADPLYLLVASATLAVMVATAIFGRGSVKLFALIFGLAMGTGLSLLLGLYASGTLDLLGDAPLVGLPDLVLPEWRFDVVLVPLFVLMAVVNSADNIGVLVSIQRLNDADWTRADLHRAGRGLQANSAGDLIAGALGGSAMGVSSTHVGLAFASGATARIIALIAGVLLLGSVFMPKVIVALASIPSPVIGAIMVYTAAFMMVSGMDLILSRMLSERRIFTVGLSIVLGLSVVLLPGVYDRMPDWLAPLFQSELAVASLAAISLNLLFRIGIAQRTSIVVPIGSDAYAISEDFLRRQGDLWGARRDVVLRATQAAAEALETLRENDHLEGEPELEAGFDEFNLDITLRWRGTPLATPDERPSPETLLEDESSLALLSGFLIRRYADRVTSRSTGRQQSLTLHFEH